MVLPRPLLLIGRMIVNKWMIVAFITAFVILEVQILQTSVPTEENEQFRHLPDSGILKEVLVESGLKVRFSGTKSEIKGEAFSNTCECLWSLHYYGKYSFSFSLKSSSRREATLEADDDHIVIFYNRVPKTGSTSFMGVIYDLCHPNKFHALHLNVSRNSHTISIPDQMRFAHNITRWKQKMPAVYHGHLAYVEFEKFGVNKRPLYINIVRKPLDRLVSYYYFLRYGDTFRPYLRRTRQGDKETFDECVQRENPDCRPEKLWLQIPFFCGHASQCWSPGNKWALEQAKRNLVEKYLLVGITEEIGDFVAILEATVPRIFKGATKVFNEGGKSHLRKTASKKPLEQSTIEYFEQSKIWKMENEFYEFANKLFQTAKKRALTSKRGVLEPIGKQFFYEKIRPKAAN